MRTIHPDLPVALRLASQNANTPHGVLRESLANRQPNIERLGDDALLTLIRDAIELAEARGLEEGLDDITGGSMLERRIARESRKAKAGQPNSYDDIPLVREAMSGAA